MDDLESTPSEAGSTRQPYRSRNKGKGGEDYQDDLLTPGVGGSGKPPLRGNRQRLSHDNDVPGESFVAKYRRERESSLLSEDSFAPKRSDEVGL